ncbi:MAG TPA: hypothetical protein PKH75_13345 [Bacillota bacterium]|jgi:hypothetical protein|nr:hypothetical protein [Bacillota bacterium]
MEANRATRGSLIRVSYNPETPVSSYKGLDGLQMGPGSIVAAEAITLAPNTNTKIVNNAIELLNLVPSLDS